MIFKELDSTDKVAGRVTSVRNGLFSGDHPGQLTDFFHDSIDTELSRNIEGGRPEWDAHIKEVWTKPQKEDYYAEIYQEEVNVGQLPNLNAEQQFTVTYGNINGFGSPMSSAFDSKSPKITKTIYSQYKNILLNPDDKYFTFTQKIDNSFVGYNSDAIYVINFSTSRMKERLDEGNFLFTLGVEETLVGATENTPTINAKYKVSFQDNSIFGSNVNYVSSSPQFGRVFDLFKTYESDRYNNDGSDVIRNTSAQESYIESTEYGEHDIRYCPTRKLSFGLVYPDLGIIVLNPTAIADQLKEGLHSAINKLAQETRVTITEDGNYPDYPEYKKEKNEGAKFAWYGEKSPISDDESFDATNLTETELLSRKNTSWPDETELQRVGGERNHQNFKKLIKLLQAGENFECRSTEIIPSKHYFIRIKNMDFNYSNNPSFVYQGYEADIAATRAEAHRDEYLGRVRHADFIADPRVYITTIGLYNENNDLVAVAKLSKPILKTFDSEALVKVKLDF